MSIFRDEFDYLLGVFGDPSLGFYYVDYRDAVRDSYGAISGGTVYLIKQCSMRGKVVTDELELKVIEGSDTSGNGWLTIDNPCVFKCSATDLTNGGVLDALGNYPYADDTTTTIVEGILNHKYIMWHNELYEVKAVQKGIVYRGDLSGVYFTTTKDVDTTALYGKAKLVIVDTPDTPVIPPDPVEPDTFSVIVDGVVTGTHREGAVVTLAVPTKEGYDFEGWSSEDVTITNNTFTMPGKNVVITSLWSVITVPSYVVTVIDPSKSPSTYTRSVEQGAGLVLSTDYYTGYNFSMWQLTSGTGTWAGGNTNKSSTFYPTSDCTITAVWTEIVDPRHTVTFVGVAGLTTAKYEAGTTVTINAGTKEGYDFVRWTADPAVTFKNATVKYTSFTMPDSDVTVTAVWQEIQVTVTFMVNGEVYDTQVLTYGGSATSPGTPVVDGYDFEGWFSDGVEFSTDLTFTEDTTFEAKLTEIEVPGPDVSEEVSRIDLNSEYTADYLLCGLYFTNRWAFSGDISSTAPFNNTRVKQGFYMGDWGSEIPPKEFTTTWASGSWAVVYPKVTLYTIPSAGQQTVLNLYSKRAPALNTDTSEPRCGNPQYSSQTYKVACLGLANNEYTIPPATKLVPILLTVVPLDNGWYRYEFGFIGGAVSGNFGNGIADISSRPVTATYGRE